MKAILRRRSGVVLAVALVSVCAVAVGRGQSRPRRFVPVTDAMLQKPDPADWLMWRRTLDGWGFSPLNQISRANVAQLRMVWMRGLGQGDPEGTALIAD